MGTAIFMVLMVCGYWYSSHDLSTRFKFKRSFGWDVYFLVALYGCVFVLQGMLATAVLWLVLLVSSLVTNALPGIFGPEYHHWHMTFMNWTFLGIQAPVVIMLAFAVVFCLWRSNWSPAARLDTSGRRELYKHLSRANGVEGLVYQCMEKGDLAWITLTSQRIYIGMIHTATFDSADANNIVLIPMLSGYRDRETLDLHVEHNYSAWYADHDIDVRAAVDFRKVLLLSQVESLSLFHPAQVMAMGIHKSTDTPAQHL
ncbi:TPA: hypothetical protein I8271_001719 [Kluyvera intermedia]|mgnify:CR=1 FL=1|jgi:hypothetical protein|uniref:Uncharacterized protein n=2 Tax=Enterobacteriaceae TaxID=543 RepID=A0AAC8QP45_9ENTR|nr:hypothetical protein [Phytobacter ursingii]MDU6682785.1 hypothetical protein [Enterobacteriaceae bacterium]HAT2204774.1 hypothetical protein [Kluyvera intermedia]AKL12390.1 hypothetical protein AB182_14225 [Phytobacter ursingii]HAT2515335.1 hypothetical protein [Kluyvera intermedia]HAT2603100.1 hypothetical protein [Kluyvera intermedia]